MEDSKTLEVILDVEISPEADVVFAPVDSNGSPGNLNKYVLKCLGYKLSKLPSSKELKSGFALIQDNGKPPIIFIVTVQAGLSVRNSLQKNLTEVLIKHHQSLFNQTIWIPLMGTGVGSLSSIQSLRATIAAIKESGILLEEESNPEKILLSCSRNTNKQTLEKLQSIIYEAFPVGHEPVFEKVQVQRDSVTGDINTIKVWVISGIPDENRTVDLPDLKKGDTLSWEVPVGSRQNDFAFMWVANGYGFLYVMKVIEDPESDVGGKTNSVYANLSVLQRLKTPISFEMLKEDSVLSEWNLVRRNMQGAIRIQKKDLRMQPDIWQALANLFLKHNSSLRSLFEKMGIEPSRFNLQKNWLCDLPTGQDQIGHAPIVSALSTFLRSEHTRLPLTIGIDAPWGTGKSSVMYMLQKELQQNLEEIKEQEILNAKQKKFNLSWGTLYRTLKEWPNVSIESLVNNTTSDIDNSSELQVNQASKQRQYETVYFNAWRHGYGTQLTSTLVNHIMNTIANRLGIVEKEKFWLFMNLKRLDIGLLRRKAFSKMLTSSVLGIAALGLLALSFIAMPILYFLGFYKILISNAGTILGILAFLKYVFPKLTNYVKQPVSFDFTHYLSSPDYGTLMGPQTDIEKDFQETLGYLKRKGKSLAIFIDDLDRCSPDKIVEVVEAINVFFGQEVDGCVFVIGMHRELVASSLEIAYRDLVTKIRKEPQLSEELPYGQRFLEKIVQFVVRLPDPKQEDVDQYIKHLTGKKSTKPKMHEKERNEYIENLRIDQEFLRNEPEHLESIENDLIQKGYDKEVAKVESGNLVRHIRTERIAQSFEEKSDEVLQVFNLVRDSLRKNPRQYVRFFNALRFDYHLNATPQKGIPKIDDLLTMAKWVVISLEWPSLANILVRRKDDFNELVKDSNEGDDLEVKLRELIAQIDTDYKLKEIVDTAFVNGRLNELLEIQIKLS